MLSVAALGYMDLPFAPAHVDDATGLSDDYFSKIR